MPLPRLNIPAADDGVIDTRDIELGVYVIIPRYSNAREGDTIILYWGAARYTVTISDRLQDFPVLLKIAPEDTQTEGYFNVFYEVIDPANNPSLSEVTEVFICAGCTMPQTLPPLYIQHAEEDNWLNLQEVSDDNGVVLYINADAIFGIGDKIIISWQEKYSDGSPVIGSSVNETIVLTEQNIGQRLSVLIPLDKVMLTDNGVMMARYTLLTTSSGEVNFSDAVSASFNFSSGCMLPPPLILHKDNHGQVSTKDILDYQGIHITVPASDYLLVGDELNVYWQGYTSEGAELPLTAFHVKTTYSGSGDTDIHIPVEYISLITNGTGRVYYSVSHDEDINISPADDALIAFNSSCDLQAPDITFAIGHQLTYAQITQLGGVELSIHGEGLSAGDTLCIYSSAYDENGMYIPALYFTAPYPLSHEDVLSGFTFLIPQSYYAREPGYHYSIEISPVSQPTCGAFNYFNLSEESSVVGDNLYVSTGYYPWGQDTLQKCYVKFNADKPNVPVTMKLSGEGYFVSNHTQDIIVNSDRYGIASATISSESNGTNEVTIVDQEGRAYGISMTANNLSAYRTPWLEYVENKGSVPNTQTFNAHIDVESGHFLLKTSSGTIFIEGQDCGNIVYNYEIIHGAIQHFDVRAIGGFTISLCDLSGRVFCACSL